MSHFYGYLKGSKGQTTRCGGKDSGISAHIKSWSNDVYTNLNSQENGEDVLIIDTPKALKTYINSLEVDMELITRLFSDTETLKKVKEILNQKKVEEEI